MKFFIVLLNESLVETLKLRNGTVQIPFSRSLFDSFSFAAAITRFQERRTESLRSFDAFRNDRRGLKGKITCPVANFAPVATTTAAAATAARPDSINYVQAFPFRNSEAAAAYFYLRDVELSLRVHDSRTTIFTGCVRPARRRGLITLRKFLSGSIISERRRNCRFSR